MLFGLGAFFRREVAAFILLAAAAPAARIPPQLLGHDIP